MVILTNYTQQPMDVDEEINLSKPKAKPAPEPEPVSLTKKTPAEIKPTVCKMLSVTKQSNMILFCFRHHIDSWLFAILGGLCSSSAEGQKTRDSWR